MNYKKEATEFLISQIEETTNTNLLKWLIKHNIKATECYNRLYTMMTEDGDTESAKALIELSIIEEDRAEQKVKENLFK